MNKKIKRLVKKIRKDNSDRIITNMISLLFMKHKDDYKKCYHELLLFGTSYVDITILEDSESNIEIIERIERAIGNIENLPKVPTKDNK